MPRKEVIKIIQPSQFNVICT